MNNNLALRYFARHIEKVVHSVRHRMRGHRRCLPDKQGVKAATCADRSPTVLMYSPADSNVNAVIVALDFRDAIVT
jgi:hypothetical protein